jgi:hypothetical protein
MVVFSVNDPRYIAPARPSPEDPFGLIRPQRPTRGRRTPIATPLSTLSTSTLGSINTRTNNRRTRRQ